jgi:hypothetical protein
MFGKRRRVNTGVKDSGTRRQVRLKIERTSDGFNKKAFGLEFVKQSSRDVQRVAESEGLDIVEGSVSSGAGNQGLDIVKG